MHIISWTVHQEVSSLTTALVARMRARIDSASALAIDHMCLVNRVCLIIFSVYLTLRGHTLSQLSTHDHSRLSITNRGRGDTVPRLTLVQA